MNVALSQRMPDPVRVPRSWITFTGVALAIAILHWAQEILVPFAFAILLAFVLAPVVAVLQRWVGRVAAVLGAVTLSVVGLVLLGWLVTQQLGSLAGDIPAYQQNLREKVRDIRGYSEGGVLDKLQNAAGRIAFELGLARSEPTGPPAAVVEAEPGLTPFDTASDLLGRLGVAGLIVALVIFILLEREQLRARLIRLFGHGRLVATTRAFDEAGWRVSHYLLAQSLVNVVFGVSVGLGMYLIGMPYPLLWATLGGVARYVPYIGPTIAAALPLLVSLALVGWTKPLLVLGLFVALELFTNLVLETALYAGVAGISQVALLVSVAFWAWLWGPLGVLLATPLTVCLGVMGKHVPGLGFISTLVSDEPVLDPDINYYQRLLASDKAEAIEILERYVKDQPPESAYDAIMVRALNYAERDRIEERLTVEEERELIETTRELLDDAPVRAKLLEAKPATDEGVRPLRVFAVPANGEGDAVALRMLADLLAPTAISLDVQAVAMLASEVLEMAQREAQCAVLIVDLPPSPPSRSRYIAKRLRAQAPDLPILVARWAPPELADENADALLAVGATRVASTLLETRDQLLSLCR
jgi:predicted PurR-regulated permease PerM/DNA-directed RNA polymerase subunit F